MLPIAKKKIRSNNKQLRMLVDYMDKHRDFVKRQQSVSPYDDTRVFKEWQLVRAMLRQYGPDRSVPQWRITWRDLRKKAREEATRSDLNFSVLSQKVLDIITKKYTPTDTELPKPYEESKVKKESYNQSSETVSPLDPLSLDLATEIEINTTVKNETGEPVDYEWLDESLPLQQTMETDEDFHIHEYEESPTLQTTTEKFNHKITSRPVVIINSKQTKSKCARTASITLPNTKPNHINKEVFQVATESQPRTSSRDSTQSNESMISEEKTAKENPGPQNVVNTLVDELSNTVQASTNILQGILSTLSRQNMLLEERNKMLGLQARLESRHRLREARRK